MTAAALYKDEGPKGWHEPPKRHRRTLPYGSKKHVVEGLGVIATQAVGSTAYSQGHHVYLHRDGEEESVSGMASFALHMEEDGTFVWRMNPLSSWCEGKFTDHELREMLRIVDGLKHTDQGCFMFQVHGCVEPLIIKHEREIKKHESAIAQMTELLKDEREPKSIFVPKDKDPAGKGFHRPRDPSNPADMVEYAERRLWWRVNRDRHQDKLDTLTSGPALLRYEMLKRMRWAWRRWSGADQEWVAAHKRRKPDLIRPLLADLLERARVNDIDVLDY